MLTGIIASNNAGLIRAYIPPSDGKSCKSTRLGRKRFPGFTVMRAWRTRGCASCRPGQKCRCLPARLLK